MIRLTLINEMSDSFGRLKRAMQLHAGHYYGDLGLTLTQLHILRAISLSKPISHSHLAVQCQMTPGAISQIIADLDTAGCISRNSSNTDRRISFLGITPQGDELLRTFDARRQLLIRQAVAELPDTDLQAYMRVQSALIDTLERTTK